MGDVFARQGAGRSRDEAKGAGTGLAGDAGARGREGGSIAAASSLPRAEALGIIGGEFSERDEEKKKRKNYYYGEKRSGHSPAGEIKFRPSPGKGKEKMGNEQFSMPVKGHKGGEITPNRDVPGAVPTIRLPRFVLRRFCWRRPNARSKGAC